MDIVYLYVPLSLFSSTHDLVSRTTSLHCRAWANDGNKSSGVISSHSQKSPTHMASAQSDDTSDSLSDW